MGNKIYQFDEFVLNPHTRQLFREKSSLPITSKAFEILHYLIKNRGKVVGKEELYERIWTDRIVEEGNLPVQIFALRRLLREPKGRDSKYIKTVSGKGYCFIANVVESGSIDKSEGGNVPAAISVEARKLYHRGNVVLESRVIWQNPKKTLHQALSFFEKAIRIEPDFVLAHVGVGNTHIALLNHSLMEKKRAFTKAKEALSLALESGGDISEVYVLQGSIRMIEHDFHGAVSSFEKAIYIDPENPDGYHWNGMVCCALGAFDKAIVMAERAIELNPANLRFSAQPMRYNYYKGDYKKSIQIAKEILEFNDKDSVPYLFLALSETELGNFEPAREYIEKAIDLMPVAEFHLHSSYIYSFFGLKDEAKRQVNEVFENYPDHEISKVSLALLYDSFGDIEEAFRLLYEEIEADSSDLNILGIDPRFRNIRKDSRFAQILKQLNLVQLTN